MIFNSKTESWAIPLRKGWNIIGYPIKESSEIKRAFSSISSYLEDVKDTDGFWNAKQQIELNSLTELKWGKGYFVKVIQEYELICIP